MHDIGCYFLEYENDTAMYVAAIINNLKKHK